MHFLDLIILCPRSSETRWRNLQYCKSTQISCWRWTNFDGFGGSYFEVLGSLAHGPNTPVAIEILPHWITLFHLVIRKHPRMWDVRWPTGYQTGSCWLLRSWYESQLGKGMVRDEPSNIRSSKEELSLKYQISIKEWRFPHVHKPEPNKATNSGRMFAEVLELPSRPHTRRGPWMRSGRLAFGSHESYESWKKNWGRHRKTRIWSQTRHSSSPETWC